ncbi:MAG TPA: serine/threonine protein kinase [Casimicrobiaceae bacterium]|nr:serine/threonine protein kinase [Casimicrobiaceae bacterium]
MQQDPRAAGERGYLDIGAGDPEAPANAIPNVLANLVETETWRNSATVLIALLMTFLGVWAYNGVRDAMARTQAAGLDAILGTVVRGVDVWVNEYRLEATRLAAHPSIADPALRLADAARVGLQAACGRQEDDVLREAVPKLAGSSDVVAFLVLDREGRVLATNLPLPCGERVRAPEFRLRLDRALDGAPQFVPPRPDAQLVFESGAGGRRPLVWELAPVRAGDRAAGAVLAIGVLADREFARLFASARAGGTTEAYAFGDDGLLVTSTSFANELVETGVFRGRNGSSVFVVPVRDPGGDLMAGFMPSTEPAARPFTQAAALAIAARGKAEAEQRGTIVEPYRSYTGREVLGAWRWLPAYDLGVVAERSVQEAFAALRYLRIAFAVLGGFIVVSLIAALSSGVSIARLRRQFGRLQRLGSYTLEREISEGGMATIYLARHSLLKRPTALKVLKKTIGSDEFVHRFEREVQLASQLRHPNTVQIYDFGRTREGQPYYVMEYLNGVTLTELVNDAGPVPPGRTIHILRQVAAALREAHNLGLIHRDVKPDNIMLCRRGEDDYVKLLDFGLVKDIGNEQTRDVTRQMTMLGTPRYMAPERLRDPSDVDARADLYALGAVGYFLLTGRHAFEGDDSMDIGQQVLHRPAPRVSDVVPTVPEGLDALIAACLEKDRTKRPASAQVFVEALDRTAGPLAWTQRDATAWWEDYEARRRAAAGT